jgi:hypothetical protein
LTLSNPYKVEKITQKQPAAIKSADGLTKEPLQEQRHYPELPHTKPNQAQNKKFISWLLPF